MSHGGGDPVKVIKAALIANGGIAVCKFIAAYLSESTATLAEAVHSVADTGNQALLLVGIRLALRDDVKRFAFGRAAERYFWPFIVALLLFSVGGAFALYEGIHKVAHPEPHVAKEFFSFHGPLVSLVVLGVSAALESVSCYVALKEFRISSKGKTLKQALFDVKDPTIPLVLMEDISALTGLFLAFIAVGLTALTNNAIFDAIGSITIGALLMVVATFIAVDAHSLLIGEKADVGMELEVQDITEQTPGVRKVTQLLTMHLGPDFIVLAMKVAFSAGATIETVEETINEIEKRIRAKVPDMKKIFVEPDSKGDRRGVHEGEVAVPPRTAAEAGGTVDQPDGRPRASVDAVEG